VDKISVEGYVVIGGIIVTILFVWAAVWFMVPFYIRTIRGTLIEIKDEVTTLRVELKERRTNVVDES
jgi:hypothetical protein